MDMTGWIRKIFATYNKFIMYTICGGSGVFTDFLIYSVLVFLSINYQIANAIGYATGTCVSFCLNRHFTFKIYDDVFIRFIKFIGVAFIGYILSTLILYLNVEIISVHKIIAKVITLGVVLFVQYSLNKYITFSRSEKK